MGLEKWLFCVGVCGVYDEGGSDVGGAGVLVRAVCSEGSEEDEAAFACGVVWWVSVYIHIQIFIFSHFHIAVFASFYRCALLFN